MRPHRDGEHPVVDLEFQRRVPPVLHQLLGTLQPVAELVDVIHGLERLGQHRVAVGVATGQRVAGDGAVQAAGVLDLDAVAEPVEANRAGGGVIPVHHRVQQQLAQRPLRISRPRTVTEAGALPERHRVVRVDAPAQGFDNGAQIAVDLLLVDRPLGHRRARKPDELDIGAGQEVARVLAEQQDAGHGRAVRDQVEAAQRGVFFLGAAVVGGDDIGVDSAGAVVVEQALAEVVGGGTMRWTDIERFRVSQHSMSLIGVQRAAGSMVPSLCGTAWPTSRLGRPPYKSRKMGSCTSHAPIAAKTLQGIL